ncbi:MAG TPA: hypothetical protein ENH91_06030 [Leeuwenhoekiella sp.]|nr:hypothetical protein [Leeuwenhoekiella sp.]
MTTLATIAIFIIAISIIIVWVFRFDNIVKEFKQYGLPDLVRNMVGALKIAISTLLVTGIWYNSPVVWPALAMAFLMLCAQFAHIRVKNPLHKYLPSLGLLLLSLFVAGVYAGIL